MSACCYWCGRRMFGLKHARKTDMGLMRTRDHLKPWAAGGDDRVGNVVASCLRCNNVRGATPEEVWREFVEVVLRREPHLGRDETARRLALWKRGRWLAWAREVLGKYECEMLAGLVRDACLREGVSPWEVAGKTRRPEAARARWRVWGELRRRGWKLAAMGRLLGRDHTTVIYGLRRVDDAQLAEADVA